MYHAESDTPARVRTMNLNEDLGQVCCVCRLCVDAAERAESTGDDGELSLEVPGALVEGVGCGCCYCCCCITLLIPC